jgi:hypothetical protein
MKTVFGTSLILLLLMSIPVTALGRTLVQYEVRTDKGCKIVGYHNIAKPETTKTVRATWTGKCKDGYAEGEGVVVSFDGIETKSTYIGTLVKGKPEGDGSEAVIKKDGQRSSARGSYVAGMLSGYVTSEMTKADGSTFGYIGNFKDGAPNGVGTLTLPKYSVTGTFDDGKPAGVVTLTMKDGTLTYEGRVLVPGFWPDGRGTMTFKNGVRLTSTFENGKPGSTGRIDYPNGDLYEGQLQGYKPHGIGKMTSTSRGEWFEGEFRDGRPDGDGVVGTNAGQRAEVTFADGKPTRRGQQAQQQQPSAPVKQSSEGSGWETLGNVLDALATGYLAGQQAVGGQSAAPQQSYGSAGGSAPTYARPPGVNGVLVTSQPIKTSMGNPGWRCVYSANGRNFEVMRGNGCPNQMEIK